MKPISLTRLKLYALVIIVTGCLSIPAVEARTPNDFYFNEQWYLSHIGAPDAWRYSLGMETVPVAIIDSGVDLDHPDLKDNIWRNMDEISGYGLDNDRNGFIDDVFGWDFVDSDNDPNPNPNGDYSLLGVNHGTVSAGIVSAKGDNGLGIVGITWQAPIMVLRALDSSGLGDPSRVAQAVDYAAVNGAKVINLSFVGITRSSVLDQALRRAYDRGVFIVAAAGNAAEGQAAIDLDVDPRYPVCFDSESNVNYIYGVAATDADDKRASFSNYGAACIDISAPGSRIISTQATIAGRSEFTDLYGGYYNGTSVAAPLVSGLVALMYSLDSHLTQRQIMNILTETSFDIDSANSDYFGRLGRGRIEADKAVIKVAERQNGSIQPPEIVTPTALLAPANSSSQYIVTAPGAGREPEVRLFTEDGLFIRGFKAFQAGFRGGVSLAVGNFDGVNRSSIVAGALSGGGPHVRIFDINTRPIGGFFAYDVAFKGGVEVATGDLDGDGIDEIVTGAGPGGGPHIRMFDKQGQALGGFFAFDDSYRGGVDVAVGDLDQDSEAEIIVAPGRGQGEVRVFGSIGNHKYSIMPFGFSYAAGFQVDLADLNGDGAVELIIRGYDDNGQTITAVYNGQRQYIGDGGSFPKLNASTVGSAVVSNSSYRTVWGSLRGQGSQVVLTANSRRSELSFFAYEPAFRGGVQALLIK